MVDKRKKSRWVVTIPSEHPRCHSIAGMIRKNYSNKIRVQVLGPAGKPTFLIYALELKDMKEINAYVAGIFAGIEMMS